MGKGGGVEKVFSLDLGGKMLGVRLGGYVGLASSSCIVTYGETVVSVAVSVSENAREGVDFFPLSVDYEEKFYACGRIPASFSRREGKPTEYAILTSRLIDRSIRPLFPKDLRNEVSVVCTVLSMDPDSSPEMVALIGASVALSVSEIPWDGPVGAVYMGLCDGKFLFNPSLEEQKNSLMMTAVVSTEDLVTMLESQAKEVPNDVMLQAIKEGHEFNKKIIEFIKGIQSDVGKKKFEYESNKAPEDFYKEVYEFTKKDLKKALEKVEKSDRAHALTAVYEKAQEHFTELYPDLVEKLNDCLYLAQKDIVRRWILQYKKRVDGRGLDEIRPLSAQVSFLPRAHGSAVFTRGQTQVLSVVTLGSIKDRQLVDDLYGEREKRYIHHYNFPAYSVGEVKPLRAPGRREIGHGALAEKALLAVIPSEEKFPYTIRVVSDVLSSNGSTSQGSVCGSTLALMDAGVPISAPVAGISCGLVFKDKKRWVTMVDIQGLEDFFGDMDFKVAGTKKGITAIQVDTKVRGLTFEIIEQALEKTCAARLKILDDVILKTISEPRSEVSKYVPKLVVGTIAVEKIKDVIGAGGRVVQKLCSDYDCKIEISDDGKVFISGDTLSSCNKALEAVQNIVKDLKLGEVCDGKVTRVVKFGAFLEIAPGREGFCHISQLSDRRIENIDDFVKVGDVMKVKIVEIDPQGKVSLSKKDVANKVC